MNHRRVTLLLFVIGVLLAIGVLVWFFFFKQPDTTNLNTPTNPLGSALKFLRGSEFVGNGNNQDEQTVQTEVIPGEEKKLTKIWDKPTAGFSFFSQPVLVTATSTKGTSTEVILQKRATSTKMIFVDRATGYVYGVNIETKQVYQITNTTVAGVYDAYFFNNGTSVIMRYLDDSSTIISIKATVPNIAENGTPQPLEDITYLPNNVTSVSVSYSQKSASYLAPSAFGSSLYSIVGKAATLIKSSPLSELDITYGGERVYTTTKASAYILGYTLDTVNNESLLGNKTGLVVKPAENNTDFLASMWTNNGIATFIFSKKTSDLRVLSLKTIAKKCTWNRNSSYALCGVPHDTNAGKEGLPDEWYQGRVSFNDDVYMIDNTVTAENKIFNFSSETKELIDMIKLLINQNDDYLGFINKKDGALWLLHTRPLIDAIQL